MQRTVKKITKSVINLPIKKHVAAYARVSSGKEAMLNSLSAQVSYYSGLIQSNQDWEYAGVYADRAITGTKDSRPEFQRLLEDCKLGKIDMIITKSVSRFARNTVAMLQIVRELKAIEVDVYFEKENIHSMSGDGELMLTILSSFAQEESLSVSENCKWRIRDKFKQGIPTNNAILGYEIVNGIFKVIPEEAKVVKMIFEDYLSGMGKNAIMKKLVRLNIPTKKNRKALRQCAQWHESAIAKILRNEKYTGDLLLQKSYVLDHITKKKCINNGQLPKFYIENNHEAIIDKETFQKVQNEIKRRAQNKGNNQKVYLFTGKIICEQCGKHYRRKISNAGTKYAKPVWICSTFNRYGKAACASKQIPENILEQIVPKDFKEIRVTGPTEIKIILENNEIIEKAWGYNSNCEGGEGCEHGKSCYGDPGNT